MPYSEKIPLGNLILKLGLIKEEDLKRALAIQEHSPEKKIGTILFEMGIIDKNTLINALATNMKIDYIDLKTEPINENFVKTFSKELLHKHKVLPLKKTENNIVLAMADPLDIIAQDDISLATGCSVVPVLVWEDDIDKFLDIIFNETDIIHRHPSQESSTTFSSIPQFPEGLSALEILQRLIKMAYKFEATDFHLEPQRTNIRVRYRIDSIFYDFPPISKSYQDEIIKEIKKLAGINDVEELKKLKSKTKSKIENQNKKVPSKGRIIGKYGDLDVNLRVFFLPILYGEKIAFRLLNLRNSFLELEQLGLSNELLPELEEIIHQPYGFILISGPAGSGRSTTFYSILRHLTTHQSSVFTIEDPIEHTIPDVTQVQLDNFCEFDFNTALQAVIDQMPDVLFVSRIMSKEMAQAAFEVALSGRLVIGTTHAFDTASTLTRLLDFGVEPFLLCSCLLGIISQRLIRSLCPHCKEVYEASPVELEKLGVEGKTKLTLYKAVGCKECFNSGYHGRIAIYEIFKIKEGIRDLILKKVPAASIAKSAEQTGMITLRDEGIKKVKEGVTTIEELFRVVSF